VDHVQDEDDKVRALLNRKERLQNLLRGNRHNVEKSATNIEEVNVVVAPKSTTPTVVLNQSTHRSVNESPSFNVSRSKINN
jgi:hypothetical protein